MRGETGRGEPGPGQPAGERERDHDPERAAGRGCRDSHGECLAEHQAANLAGGRPRGPQQPELAAPGGHGVGERAGHHEDGDEPGKPAGGAEQGCRHGEQPSARIGLGVAAVVAGQYPDRLPAGGCPHPGGQRRDGLSRRAGERDRVDPAAGELRGDGVGRVERGLRAGAHHAADREPVRPVGGLQHDRVPRLTPGGGGEHDLAGPGGRVTGDPGVAVHGGRRPGVHGVTGCAAGGCVPGVVDHRGRAQPGQPGGEGAGDRTGLGGGDRLRLAVVAGTGGDRDGVGTGDNHAGAGEPARLAGRAGGAGQGQCHRGEQRDAQGQRDETAGQAGGAGPGRLPGEPRHDPVLLAPRSVIRAATDCGVGPYSSPATWPSARKTTRLA